jgi:hypothetical protein
MLDKFNAANYKKHQAFAVLTDDIEGFDDSNSLTLSPKLIVVTWQLQGRPPKDKRDPGLPVGTGVIRVTPLPTPIGLFPPTDFNMGVYNNLFVQFLDLSKMEVDYRLSFKNPKGIARTQVTIQEYVDNNSYINNSSSTPVIA